MYQICCCNLLAFVANFELGDNPGISLNDCSLVMQFLYQKPTGNSILIGASTLLFLMVCCQCWSLQRLFYFGGIAFISDLFEMTDDSTKCSTYIPKTHCILIKISLSDYYVVYYKWHNTKAVNNVLYEFKKSLDWFALFFQYERH